MEFQRRGRRFADNLKPFPIVEDLRWTKASIHAECSAAYRQYERELREHYVSYFAARPWLRCRDQPHSASTLSAALPPGLDHLQRLISRGSIHLHARSAKSSQTLALALIGSAATRDPSLDSLWRAANLPSTVLSGRRQITFEYRLRPGTLNEQPRTTQLDIAVETETSFTAIESKWTESGWETCSCLRCGDGSHLPGGFCAERVLARTAYWQTARDFFRLPAERLPLLPCPIAPIYQVLRNIAAARALAGPDRCSSFVLLFDAKNPFFRPTGRWPGWPAFLREKLDRQIWRNFVFRAISWQELVPQLPLAESTRRWAREKHRLPEN